MTCGAEGSLSILGLAPAGALADGPGGHDPVLVHLTVCRTHLKIARAWLRARMEPEDEPVTASTAFVMDHWQQTVGHLDLPVWDLQRATS